MKPDSLLKGRAPVHRFYTRNKVYDMFFKFSVRGIAIFSIGVCGFVVFDLGRMLVVERPQSVKDSEVRKARDMEEKQQAAIMYLKKLEQEKKDAEATKQTS